MFDPNTQILFTRQKHEAVRAGTHYDIRLVLGDKAYSWATRKEIPEPGKVIILYEQPVHTAHYALSERVEIPAGSYGHGVTTLDFVRKAKIGEHSTADQFTLHTDKEKFLLKRLDEGHYGKKTWLFKNLSPFMVKEAEDIQSRFQPDLTPAQMKALGVLAARYYEVDPKKGNYFGVEASMKEWPKEWYNEQDPLGWFQWWVRYSEGRRSPDDDRQMKRWISFKARHLAQLQKADPTLQDLSVQPKRRQALLNWGIAPGIDKNNIEKTATVTNRYLDKIASFKKAEDKKDTRQTVLGAYAGTAVGTAAAMPIAKLQQRMFHKTMDSTNHQGAATTKDLKNFIRKNNLNTTFSPHKYTASGSRHGTNPIYSHVAQSMGPSFVPNVDNHKGPSFVNARMNGKAIKNHDITMHELGHAKNWKTFGKHAPSMMKGVGRASQFSGGAGILAMHEKTRDYALPAYALMQAPRLADETMAHFHAHKFLRKAHGAAAGNKYLRTALPALSTYFGAAAAGALPVAGAVAGSKLHSKERDKHEAKEKLKTKS